MAANPEQTATRAKSGPVPLVLALVACIPGSYLGLAELFHFGHPELAPPLLALVYGVAVIGAAFVLAWAAEAAQLDVSASLAIGVLALIAVLPEYAVGFVFAWKGGNDVEQYGPSCQAPDSEVNNCSLVLANMTGANRLLIGIGWSLIVFIAYWQWRRKGERHAGVTMERSKAVELAYLSLACAYCLTLPLKRTVTLIDAVILVNLSISLREAFALFGLFWAQFILGAVVPPSAKGVELLVLSAVYILLGLWLLVRKHGAFRHMLVDGFRTPYSELEPEAAEGPSRPQVTK